MKAKEVIQLSAELLGIELTKENTEYLLHCYNLVEHELATDYIPLRAVDNVLIAENKIKYADLKNKPYRILDIQSVLDRQNKEIKYKLFPEYIELAKNYNGHRLYIKYSYIPKTKDIDDNCDYSLMYEDILKYGVCSEYCLIQGDFEQGAMWGEKYKNAVKIGWYMCKAKELQNG